VKVPPVITWTRQAAGVDGVERRVRRPVPGDPATKNG